MNDRSLHAFPADQAAGLRRLFAKEPVRLVPVVANPHVRLAGALLERLTSALVGAGSSVLLVDAADTAPAPAAPGPCGVDLAGRIEQLSPQLGYLAARGLPMSWLDAQGSSAAFLQAVADAASGVDVLLVHAGAAELSRMLARPAVGAGVCPVLLADDRPASVTHAYAAMKLLVQRAGLTVHHLLLGAADGSPRAARIAERMASCAELFLGAALRSTARTDPAMTAPDAATPSLERLARSLALEAAAVPASAPAPRVASAARHDPKLH